MLSTGQRGWVWLRRAQLASALMLLFAAQPAEAATTVTQVAAGYYHTLFLKSDGSLWAMGDNKHGQLGDGTTNSRLAPVLVMPSSVVAVAAGAYHSVFLKADGNLWAMGLNSNGQLGDGTTAEQHRPEQITFTGGIRAVAAGGYHTLYLKGNALWGMGANAAGQLGDGNAVDVRAPIQLQPGGVAQVAAGDTASFYISTDGSLWAMGGNTNGCLGDGTLTARFQPVEVITNQSQFSRVAAVAGGLSHTLVLNSAPGGVISLWAMGDDYGGDLGDGSTFPQYRPEEVFASGMGAVAAGGHHSALIESDGSLWTMGQNLHGDLGDGGTAEHHTPERIVSSNVTAIAAGLEHTLFLKADGTLWGMGANGSGQLGDGSNQDAYVPERLVPPIQLLVTNISISGRDLHLEGVNDFGAGSAVVLVSTDPLTRLSKWSGVWTNSLGSGGFGFTASNVVDPLAPRRFYRLRLF